MKEKVMRSLPYLALCAALSISGCNDNGAKQSTNQPVIRVQSDEQKQLRQLDAFNLAIGLKRAIFDAGYRCNRVTDAGFVGTYKNLDMWMAHCEYDKGAPRDWAIFAGPDGSAQVRDCVIKQRPKGKFDIAK